MKRTKKQSVKFTSFKVRNSNETQKRKYTYSELQCNEIPFLNGDPDRARSGFREEEEPDFTNRYGIDRHTVIVC